jgi:hypothetical protein
MRSSLHNSWPRGTCAALRAAGPLPYRVILVAQVPSIAGRRGTNRREDRAVDRPVLAGLTQERLRTPPARACKASGTATWWPHDLRHPRISLWHRPSETRAVIGARVGQRSLSVTADTYTHVLLDDRELDHTHLATQLGRPPG